MNLVHSAAGNTGCVREESNSDSERVARVFPFEKKSESCPLGKLLHYIITCTKAAGGEKWYQIIIVFNWN